MVVEADGDVGAGLQDGGREDGLANRVHQLANDPDTALRGVPDACLIKGLAGGVGDHLRGLGQDRRTRVEDGVHQQNASPPTCAHGLSPSSCPIGFRASRTISTCSAKGIPSASAPVTSSSRCTPRANALSFIFLRTVLGSTALSDLSGLTRAHAMMKPDISSTAFSALRILESRGTLR